MANRRRPITREHWDRFLARGILPRGVSRATLYRRARAEGWQEKPPPKKSEKLEIEISRSEQTRIVQKLRIRLDLLARNRAETDQQVLRIISKARCFIESAMDEIAQRGRIFSMQGLLRVSRIMLNLEKLEWHRQEWITKATERSKRVIIVERVTRERPPEPHEMLEATEEAPATNLDAPVIPGPQPL